MKMTKMCAKNMDLTETEWWTMFFGFENIIHQILLFGVIGVTAFCLHIFWWTVLFTLTFSCLRISAGGCHLKTSLGCTCMTTLLMIGGTEIALSVDLSVAVENILFVLGLIIVFKLAPRRTENYPVSNEEDHYLKKKSVLTVCIFWGLAIILPGTFGKMMTIAMFTETLTLLPKSHA